jgi:hypothetical protein
MLFTDWSPGDRLLLYTDGIVEASDASEHFLGQDVLSDLLKKTAGVSSSDAADSIISSVRDWSVKQDDDLTGFATTSGTDNKVNGMVQLQGLTGKYSELLAKIMPYHSSTPSAEDFECNRLGHINCQLSSPTIRSFRQRATWSKLTS